MSFTRILAILNAALVLSTHIPQTSATAIDTEYIMSPSPSSVEATVSTQSESQAPLTTASPGFPFPFCVLYCPDKDKGDYPNEPNYTRNVRSGNDLFLHCEYPAFAGQGPGFWYCEYEYGNAALTLDHDASLCPPKAVVNCF